MGAGGRVATLPSGRNRLVPTRRIMELVIITTVLIFPARSVVYLWAKRQLGSQPEGTLLHGIGEVVVTVL